MKENHMIGITPAHNNPDFKLMRELGAKWVRQGYPFPFADEKGTLSKSFLNADKQIEKFRAEGFEILCSLRGRVRCAMSPQRVRLFILAQFLNI